MTHTVMGHKRNLHDENDVKMSLILNVLSIVYIRNKKSFFEFQYGTNNEA